MGRCRSARTIGLQNAITTNPAQHVRSFAGALLVATVVVSQWVGVAQAAGPSLAVTNLGQSGLVSTVPQPPLRLGSRGSCTSPRTVGEANGGTSSCPAGTWPAPGGDWSPTERVAGGDQLQLDFATAQTGVVVNGTSNYPVGLRDPDGYPVANFDAGAFVVTATADPARWLVTVPLLDQRFQGAGAAAVAVTATDAGNVGTDFAFSVALPRFPDFGNPCGQAFFAPGQSHYVCETFHPGSGGSTGAGGDGGGSTKGPPPTVAPRFVLLTRPAIADGILHVRFSTPRAGFVTVRVRVARATVYRRRLHERHGGNHSARLSLPRAARRALQAHDGRRVGVEIVMLVGGKTRSRTQAARVTP